MLATGAVFPAVGMTAMAGYLGHHDHAPAVNVGEVWEAFTARLHPYMLDTAAGVAPYLGELVSRGTLAVLVFSLLVLWVCDRDQGEVWLVVRWVGWLVVICVLVPCADQAVARWRGSMPMQIDLVRGVRYVTPLVVLLGFWAIDEMARRNLSLTLVVVLVVSLVWTQVHTRGVHFTREVLHAARAWASGRWVSGEAHDPDYQTAIEALGRLVPAGAAVLAWGGVDSLPVRYALKRSVAWCRKDGATFSYGQHRKMVEWHRVAKRMSAVRDGRDLACLARELGAGWLFTSRLPAAFGGGVRVRYANESYSVLELDVVR